MPAPRKTGDRTRRLFENRELYFKATSRYGHLLRELESQHLHNAPCIVAHSYRALIRTVGFFKYNVKTPVLLRGQTTCFGMDLQPAFALGTEPVLQHYGIDTRWLDAVDSVPHALFFATHKPIEVAPGQWTYIPSTEEYGYVFLIELGKLTSVQRAKKFVAGYSRGALALDVADLRALKPSIALRPHAQHGLLIRDRSGDPDLWNRLVARIAVPATIARRWISAVALEPQELFPDPKWDRVYDQLLSDTMKALLASESNAGRNWGTITRYAFH